jgi:hypothetical protein
MMSVEQSVEWELAGATEVLGWKPAPVPLCPPQIPHAWPGAMARANVTVSRNVTKSAYDADAVMSCQVSLSSLDHSSVLPLAQLNVILYILVGELLLWDLQFVSNDMTVRWRCDLRLKVRSEPGRGPGVLQSSILFFQSRWRMKA